MSKEIIAQLVPNLNPTKCILCPACDLKISRPSLESKQYACCPRCHTQLYKNNTLSPQVQLALSISGLLLFVIAQYYPLLEMDMYGIYGSATIMQGVTSLLHYEFYIVSALVFLCAIGAPLLFLVFLILVNAAMLLNAKSQWLKLVLTWTSWSVHWSMLEVYLVGFLVSVFKLNSMASLSYGPGTIALVLVVIINSFLVSRMDLHCYWELANGDK